MGAPLTPRVLEKILKVIFSTLCSLGRSRLLH